MHNLSNNTLRGKWQMEYQLAISPELEITPEEFAAAWNESAENRAITEARLSPAKGANYEPITLTLIAFTIGTGVAVNVLSQLINDTIQRLRDKKGTQSVLAHRHTHIEETQMPDGKRLLVADIDEQFK
jgi:hypothetical protein